MHKSEFALVTLVALLLLSLSISIVAAQYTTEKTTGITISSDGTFTKSESDIGVTYNIQGTAGATGTVTFAVFNGNQQTTASIPNGVSLAHFVAITFDMNAADFSTAVITMGYSDSDVQSIQPPYTLYKYDHSTDSYVEMPSTIDTAAKTITVTLTSINDPLFAIGGAPATTTTPGGISALTWAIIAVSIVAVVLVALFIVIRVRHSTKGPEYAFDS